MYTVRWLTAPHTAACSAVSPVEESVGEGHQRTLPFWS
jgi:hypothetical protein